ncbi:TonB-dependent receptor [Hyphomonas atlantica corrig.]|uniref:TonB-dependent receptor n=1 Tax=Hyphomonas atlantica TaxID=1280948 RepID=UPI002353F20D|nr:TonB-dependent receptor [Hyphomonas atlantica]
MNHSRTPARCNTALPTSLAFGSRLLVTTALAGLACSTPGFAQEAAKRVENTEADAVQETVVVTGIRRTLQNSVLDKREATSITDVITSDEIGNLPALSIGEVLETIPGAGANRSRVGATEFALRGLGPFFGATAFNGREASNGSGDRSVNFSQFPSELINTVRVYKSQQANQIEGGISGVVELETLRPLSAARRAIQVEVKGNYNSIQDGLEDNEPGWRGTASYVDQFAGASFGKLGVSLGGQVNRINNPIDTYGTNTTQLACNDTVDATVCPEVSRTDVENGVPYYLSTTSRSFRQTETDDSRDAVFAAIQWQPNDRWEVNLDGQWSVANFGEIRYDFGVTEAHAFVTDRVVDDRGILRSYSGISSVDSYSSLRDREETYWGGGLNVSWQATEKLNISGDLSYSDTERVDEQFQTRLRTDAFDIYGNVTPVANQRIAYSYDASGDEVPAITFDPRFDINNHDLFSDDLIIARGDLINKNSISAIRLDADYALNSGWLKAVKTGLRVSELRYQKLNDDFRYTQTDRAVDQAVNLACRIDFPQDNFLKSSDTNTITSWATFDPACQIREYLGEDPLRLRDGSFEDTGNVDVTEETVALYAMGEFETSIGDLPLTGNVGLRLINTNVTSTGLRSDFTMVNNGDGTIRLEETGGFQAYDFTHDYTEVLPSLNTTLELSDELLARAAIYRAMVRADPSDLGAGRDIQIEAGNFTDAQSAISEVMANGNPSLEPMIAWNYDVSFEYYPNRDSLFALALYYKVFEGATIPVVQTESFTVDDVVFSVPVTVSQSTDETSEIYGLEATAQYRFSAIPQAFGGLTGKVSYNYTATDFETQDIRLGAALNTATGEMEPAIVDPVSLNGQSDHVLSASLLYEFGRLELQTIYKYRSEYFQKFVGSGRQNRLIRDAGVIDLRASYRLTPRTRLSFEALNINDEPRLSDMPISGNIQAYEGFGKSYFLGIKHRF